MSSIQILLVGKTGQGKSCTGNAILQNKDAFKTSNGVSPETAETYLRSSTFKGRKLTVVDTPGLCDTRPKQEGYNRDQLIKAKTIIKKRYHAVLIVMKYNDRFSDENSYTIKVIQETFGEAFLRYYGILLFTGGDNFETEDEVVDGKLTFETWLKEQTEQKIQALIKECGDRAILFNNRCKDERESEKQVEKLIQMIDGNVHLSKPFFDRMVFDRICFITEGLIDIDINLKNFDISMKCIHEIQIEADSIYNNLKSTNARPVAILLAFGLQSSIKELKEDLDILKKNARNIEMETD